MSLTVAQIIDIAKKSQYLAQNDIANQGLFGGGVDLLLPNKIYNIRKSVEYWYELDPSDTTITKTSNALLALCNKYYLQAQSISGSGGSVSPISPSTYSPNEKQFTVSVSSYIATGESSKIITEFIGYNLIFVRNGITQYTINDGINTYYSWDKNTGYFYCSVASEGETFNITPV